ncbi:MAG: hypothetical protein WHS63_07985 [Tenuifilum sp.]|uniref:hypothetical protein n=1 Tax=Tenuifilum sp. TaxID=2760880 RepID=UPI0030B6FBBD
MRIVLTILTILIATGLNAQSDNLLTDSKEFISKTMRIYEPNPIHKEYSDSISDLFSTLLNGYPDSKIDSTLLIRLLFDNSITNYEDSQEEYRYAIRRCLIFSMYSMITSADNCDLFIDFADKSLLKDSRPENSIILESYVKNYTGFLIFKLLVKDLKGNLTLSDIQKIKDTFNKFEDFIDKHIYEQGVIILNKFEQRFD